jgi:hypothetical protein
LAGPLVQMVPLQNLNVGFFEIEAAREHACNVAVAFDPARAIEQLHDAPIFVVFDSSFRLRDKVRVIFNAHGYGA